MVWVRVCERTELAPRSVKTVALARDRHKRPREAIVLLDHEGVPKAYLNRCRHVPVPIDAGAKEYFTEDFHELLCNTHGARYRLVDGLCVWGPCKGDALERLELEERDGVLYVIDSQP